MSSGDENGLGSIADGQAGTHRSSCKGTLFSRIGRGTDNWPPVQGVLPQALGIS